MGKVRIKRHLLNALDLFKKNFSNDPEVAGAVDLLGSKIEEKEWEKEEADDLGKTDSGEPFPLPDELKQNPLGFAIFSDGACRGNPGPGAWAFMIQDGEGQILKEGSGLDHATTNNKMELEGAIKGLQSFIEYLSEKMISSEIPVYLFTDSKYVVEGMRSWVAGWKKRGWKKSDNKVPLNLLLWQELDDLRSKLDSLKFIWIKGHAGHPQNERCDALANEELDFMI